MIVKDMQPVSVVEDEGFRKFVKTLEPRYKIPNNVLKALKKERRKKKNVPARNQIIFNRFNNWDGSEAQ
ncbi:hypothetical protein COCON_G00003370 [Conger conger]|uniref:Uncharacterized protein n=1 Tax=Conger conger TaxID=82655 RepID=A0A9Q1E138_CONCO|nr:hypothetical protein COCON_G00003370 [Conger conger]